MKKTLLFLLVYIAVAVNAQNNFKDAYYINLQNDTVYGQIDLNIDKQNAKECRFRCSATSSDITVFLPGEIAAYRFLNEGKYYVSRDVVIENISQKVFLEFLVQGVMNLYYFQNENDRSYYFFEDENYEMVPISKQPNRVEGNYSIPDNRYKGVMKYVFKDYAPVVAQIDNISYDQKSMIKIAKTYHDNVCVTGEECIVYQNPNPDKVGVQVGFSVYGGMQYFTYYFDQIVNALDADITGASVECLAPLIGGQVSLCNPRWSKSLFLQLDLSFSYIGDENAILDQSTTKNEYRELNQLIMMTYSAFIVNPKLGIKYIYPKYKWRPVAEVGYAYNQFIKPSFTRNSEYEYVAGRTSKVTYSQPYKARKYFHGFYAGMGVDYNLRKEQALFLRVLYETYFKDPMLNGNDNARTLQLKIGYLF